jgi:hypothetical protein
VGSSISKRANLSVKEISCSQPMDVQENKFSKHKSAQQTIKKNKAHNNKLFDIPKYIH